MAHDEPDRPKFLSDEPTMELVLKAKTGDRQATDALIERCMKPLKRFAHGRLPSAARGSLDTDDIVQAVIMNYLRQLPKFEPREVGGVRAYLKRSVVNAINDQVRGTRRRPQAVELVDEVPSRSITQLESAIRAQEYGQYVQALETLNAKSRQLVIAKIELEWSAAEIATAFGLPTPAAAQMAAKRACQRLAASIVTPPKNGATVPTPRKAAPERKR